MYILIIYIIYEWLKVSIYIAYTTVKIVLPLVAGEVCVYCRLLQRMCLVGNSLLWRHSVYVMCCMMWLWVLAIVCASAPEWAWVVAAALASARTPQ